MTRNLLSLGISLICLSAPAFAGVTVVTPEPATMLLIGGGLGAILVVRHATKKKK
jgi:hypothetical protein